MTLKQANDIMHSWTKEVSHSEFRYLSASDATTITGAICGQLTQQWKASAPSLLRCPSCDRYGFKTVDIFSAVGDGIRLKCSKCGQWGGLVEWDEKTRKVKP